MINNETKTLVASALSQVFKHASLGDAGLFLSALDGLGYEVRRIRVVHRRAGKRIPRRTPHKH
jgi:hypothetical protein